MEMFSAILLVVTILIFALGHSDNEKFRLILIVTFGNFSVVSYFISYTKFNSESKILSILFYRIYGYGLTLAFMTLLFVQLGWPWPKELTLVISLSFVVLSLILGLKEISSENKNNINWKYFLRLIIALIPLTYMIMQI